MRVMLVFLVIDALVSCRAIFARKFDTRASAELLDKIDTVILSGRG